ncbi:putative dally [Operophtera brumata]|uniref:Putative dally n=1 Tax=Operophtera brumata TaxID=104452 RepID=A0A0L7L304_OPEBR|nr:putative dally [Operophtera brumata]
MSDQRYNPEVSGTPEQDPRVTSIADRLQQARTEKELSHADFKIQYCSPTCQDTSIGLSFGFLLVVLE